MASGTWRVDFRICNPFLQFSVIQCKYEEVAELSY